MKLYVCTTGSHEDYNICVIYLTKEEATSWVEKTKLDKEWPWNQEAEYEIWETGKEKM